MLVPSVTYLWNSVVSTGTSIGVEIVGALECSGSGRMMQVGSVLWNVARRDAMRSRREVVVLVRNSIFTLLLKRWVVSPVSVC